MTDIFTHRQILCLKIWAPIILILTVLLEVLFGIMFVTKLPLSQVVGLRTARWLHLETPSPTQSPVCSKIVLRPFQSLTMVALASYPRSGNTWTRNLLERSTGIYTGTVYKTEQENPRTRQLFPGGVVDYRSGRTICIKTHKYEPLHVKQFEAAILLIRHPFQSIVSEAYRRRELKPTMTEEERQTFYSGQRWRSYVLKESLQWRNTYLQWIETGSSTLVVHYSDLLAKPNRTLETMVSFLNVPVRQGRIKCALARYPPLSSAEEKKKESRFYTDKNPFNQELYSTVMEYIVDVNVSLILHGHKPFPSNFTVDIF